MTIIIIIIIIIVTGITGLDQHSYSTLSPVSA